MKKKKESKNVISMLSGFTGDIATWAGSLDYNAIGFCLEIWNLFLETSFFEGNNIFYYI